MADFNLDKKKVFDILDISFMVWAELILLNSQKSVPRDKKRLPNPIILKRKKTPERNIRKWNKHYYRKPVRIWGNWYEWVTWNLARSLNIERLWSCSYIVWIMAWPTEEYWKVQEFWSSDWKIPRRSFLLDPLIKNKVLINKQIQKTLNELLNK